MTNIVLETKNLQDLKSGDYLFSPNIVKDKGDSKPYILFSLIRFIKWSAIQDGTANEETSPDKIAENFKNDPSVAKIQFLGEITLEQASNPAEIEKLQKQADDKEAECIKKAGDRDYNSTYCWRSLTAGYFKTLEESLTTIKDQICEILGSINDSLEKLKNIESKQKELF